MIFDVTNSKNESRRYKNKNKGLCIGELLVHNTVVGQLSHLSIYYDYLITGIFVLVFHRLGNTRFLFDKLDIRVRYEDKILNLLDIQVIRNGIVLGLDNLDELLGKNTSFICTKPLDSI